MTHAYYAVGLSLHQPEGNLVDLAHQQPWEARQIVWAYERLLRYVREGQPESRLHVAVSGTLLMQLADPAVRRTFQHTMDLGELLSSFRTSAIELLGSAYTHPVVPLISRDDWDIQLGRYLDIARPLLGRSWFPGFFPPEMGFSMDMIPHLAKLGYRYVVVDVEHIEPVESMRWDELRYRPHWARHEGASMIVVPRDRELSNAQQSGFDPGWFAYELGERTKHSTDFPPLVTTWSDGENGGWFRNPTEQAAFWGWFYRPMIDWQRSGTLALSQISINEYLDRFGAHGSVRVREGAWNTGNHDGRGFSQWTGSLLQRRGLEELRRVSRRYHDRRWALGENGASQDAHHRLDRALWHLLRAQTSCNFFWGSRWVHRAFDDLEQAERLIDEG